MKELSLPGSSRPQRGFTLIELSIVLVIIGLVAGAIIVGRDLIRAAELQSVLSDLDRFKAAINTFQTQYNCIPGDCTNATQFWGTDPGGCPDTPANTTPKTATCNGNGDGHIDDSTVGGYTCEQYRIWQQLADAGLISGSYTGTTASPLGGGCNKNMAVSGINVASGRISGSAFVVRYYGINDISNWGTIIPGGNVNKNYILFTGLSPIGVYPHGILNPQEAYNIDSKIDDGIPYSGNVLESIMMYGTGNDGECVTHIWSLPSSYVLSSSNITCAPAFVAGF